MAKGNKHSPALFEVVHGKKHFDKSARDISLRTPSWWFKGRKRMADVGALAPAGGAAAVEVAPPFGDADIPPSAADPTENPSFLAARDATGDRMPERESDDSAPVDTMTIPSALMSMTRSRRRSAFQFLLDRDRHELFVRVRYTAAAIAGVSVVMLIALAYLTGRHTGRGPASALASLSAEEIAAGPIEKGALELAPRGGNAGAASTGRSGSAPAFTSVGNSGAAARPSSPQSTTAGPTTQSPFAAGPTRSGNSPSEPTVPPGTAPANNGKRIVGHQYVLVQSYPPEQKKTAEEARDLLGQAGVICTVEKAPAGWPPTWFSVVGTTGFERASGAAYDNYMAAIGKVNDRFAGKASFKRFDPTAIRWKERAD